jgi:hypothetical protein
MMSWWETERFAEFQMQERMREAERERLIRQARGADARHSGLLSLAGAWLNGWFLAPTRRRQERCCTAAGLGQSQSEPHGSLIL